MIQKNNERNLFFFLSIPFLGFFLALRNFSAKHSRVIILMFIAMFGWSYIIPSDTYDISRYVQKFFLMGKLSLSDFTNQITNLYVDKNLKPDFGLDIIAFVVSRFSDSQNLFILTLAIVAGTLLLYVLHLQSLIYARFKNINSLIFLIFLIILLPIYNIGQFRFYTATLIFTAGVIFVFEQPRNIKYFLLTAISIIFHFAYILPVSLLLIYIILGNKNYIYFPILVSSFIFSELTIPYLKDMLFITDFGSFERIVKGYTSRGYFEQVLIQIENTEVWLLNTYRFFNKYFFTVILLVVYLGRFKQDQYMKNLISFSLLLLSMINYFEGIRDVNQRFAGLFSVLIIILLIRLFSINRIRNFQRIAKYSLLLLVINFIVVFRSFLSYTNITLFLPTPFPVFFINSHTSLLDILNIIR